MAQHGGGGDGYDEPHYNQLSTSDITNWVTPMSSLSMSRNSRGVTYDIKVYVPEGQEVLDTTEGSVLDQFEAFDKEFCRRFGVPRDRK